MTSARSATSSSKTLALSWWMITVACPEMAADKGLVGRARVGDEPHPRLIDRGKVGEAVAVLAARQRALAVDKGRNRKKGLLSARRRDGDAAHRDVEPVGEEVVEQIDPHGGHELDVDA